MLACHLRNVLQPTLERPPRCCNRDSRLVLSRLPFFGAIAGGGAGPRVRVPGVQRREVTVPSNCRARQLEQGNLSSAQSRPRSAPHCYMSTAGSMRTAHPPSIFLTSELPRTWVMDTVRQRVNKAGCMNDVLHWLSALFKI